jgi:TRAP-type C4-dicarboxylate transport system permease small subunit
VTSWRALAVRLCGILAGLCLAAMMLLIVTDVVLRSGVNIAIRGTFDLVELLLAGTFFLALPAAFLRDDHILVDVIDRAMPNRVGWLRRAAQLLAGAIVAVMAWQGWKAAQDTLVFNDVTSDLELPRVWYWIPVLIGMISSGVAAVVLFFHPNREP